MATDLSRAQALALRIGFTRLAVVSSMLAALFAWHERAWGQEGEVLCPSSLGVARYFPCDSYFNVSVDGIVLTPEQRNYSDRLLNGLAARGGWGNDDVLQADVSIDVLEVDAGHPFNYEFDLNDGWIDSDPFSSVPAPVPGSFAGFESLKGPICDGGDCHYIVLDKGQRKLIEVYRAEVSGTKLANAGDGAAVEWPFDKVWTESLRGDVCTSADAAGLSIGAMLFSADELRDGSIEHAIRFILPNSRIADRTYVRPATHTTGGDGWAPAPKTDLSEPPLADPSAEPGIPYGIRLRLKASYDISGLPPAAQVIARALKKYGMILADGGEIALTGRSDQNTDAKYVDVGFSPRDLAPLKVIDFEVVPPQQPAPFAPDLSFRPTIIGPMIKVESLDCIRNP